jgi:hypothetical protein
VKTAFASNLIKYFELLAGLVGMVCYYKKLKSPWFAFAVFLVLLFGMEILGGVFVKAKLPAYNIAMYKWVTIPAIFMMYHYLYHSFAIQKAKRFILVSAAIFIILTIAENIFLSKQHFYSISLALSYGCLSVLVLSLNYFFLLIKSNDILHFNKLMPFWFCLALLLFYLGSFPYLTFFNSMAIAKNRSAFNLYRWIFIYLNWIMYLLMAIGFICSRPKS